VLSGAESSYNDWRGTACAEDSMVVGAGDLYELAGIADERESGPGQDRYRAER